MNSTVKERDYFFDNYRFLLIFLVVVGHFIEPCFRNHVHIKRNYLLFSYAGFHFYIRLFLQKNLFPEKADSNPINTVFRLRSRLLYTVYLCTAC